MISIAIVAVVTAALVIILSVFNGMEDLIRSLFESFDPALKIESAEGKSFVLTDSIKIKVSKTEGVVNWVEVIEDNAMITYKDQSEVIRLKGVGDSFLKEHRMDTFVIDGKLRLEDTLKRYSIIGAGVQYKLSISLNNEFAPISVYYPNKDKLRKGGTNLASQLNTGVLHPTAVFAIEKQFDDHYIIAPISFAQDLMGYDQERTSIEVSVSSPELISKVKNELKVKLGNKFSVLDSDEQHATLLKALKIEKLAVSIIVSSVLAVASVGIYFCLSVLVLRKRKDMTILKALGANEKKVKAIFYLEGQLIAFVGAALGLLLGFATCALQQAIGFAKMGMNTSVVDAYPVKMQLLDFIAVLVVVVVLTFIASIKPAQKAAKNLSFV